MRRIHSVGVFVVAGLLFAGCSDEETFAPPVDTCDDAEITFSISNPEVGHVYVWGGTGTPGMGSMGHLPGYTRLYWPIDVCFDPSGSPIIPDWNNHRVLSLDGSGKFQKMIGRYFGNPVDGPALEADLNHPTHVCFSADGSKLYLAAWHNSVLMEMDMTTTWLARYAGTGARNYNADGLGRLQTALDLPVCVAFHPVTGEMYFSDQANHLVRRIDAGGVVHIVAGTAPVSNGVGGWIYQSGYAGDGGPATSALLSFDRTQMANPAGRICFDTAGNLYIADTRNHAVRIVTPDGNINTLAGMGPGAGPGYAGDGGPATQALLNWPTDVVVASDGTVFIADTGNHVIRQVALDGTISTAVGVEREPNPKTGEVDPISACQLEEEHGALATKVHLTGPYGIEVDADNNLWIADTQNNVIRILYR